jgi:PAS domain S-box-containing protein
MTTPEDPAEIDGLLTSAEMIRALENKDFKQLLDHIPVPVAVSRSEGGEQRNCYVNGAFEALSGLTETEVRGKNWSILDSFCHEDDQEFKLGRALNTQEDYVGTFRRGQTDHPTILIEAYVNAIEAEDGSESYRIAALVDVSARERSQREEFQRRIRDKDLLLREIQHRVKNNLQLIVALIRLEARNARDDAKSIDIDRLAGRIEAVHVLYKTLEGPGHGQEIDLGQYAGQIATAAMGSYAVEGVRLELQADCCPASINVALPTGLVINEAMTNAFKYAFADRDGGVITVRCFNEGDRYRLIVKDDGVGLPQGTTWPQSGKLSALIIQSLRENTKAVVAVTSAPGAGTQVEIILGPPVPIVH